MSVRHKIAMSCSHFLTNIKNKQFLVTPTAVSIEPGVGGIDAGVWVRDGDGERVAINVVHCAMISGYHHERSPIPISNYISQCTIDHVRRVVHHDDRWTDGDARHESVSHMHNYDITITKPV